MVDKIVAFRPLETPSETTRDFHRFPSLPPRGSLFLFHPLALSVARPLDSTRLDSSRQLSQGLWSVREKATRIERRGIPGKGATKQEGRRSEKVKRGRRERTQLISRVKFSGASRSTNRAGQKGSLCFSQKIIKRVMVQQGEPWLHTECRSCQLYAITARSPPFPPRFCIPVFFSFFPTPSPLSLPSASFPPFFSFFSSFLSFFPLFSFPFFSPSLLMRLLVVATRHYRRGLFYTLCIFIRLFRSPKTVTVVVPRFIVPAFRVATPRRERREANRNTKRKHRREKTNGLGSREYISVEQTVANRGAGRVSRLKNQLKDPPPPPPPPLYVPPILSLHPLFHEDTYPLLSTPSAPHPPILRYQRRRIPVPVFVISSITMSSIRKDTD